MSAKDAVEMTLITIIENLKVKYGLTYALKDPNEKAISRLVIKKIHDEVQEMLDKVIK